MDQVKKTPPKNNRLAKGTPKQQPALFAVGQAGQDKTDDLVHDDRHGQHKAAQHRDAHKDGHVLGDFNRDQRFASAEGRRQDVHQSPGEDKAHTGGDNKSGKGFEEPLPQFFEMLQQRHGAIKLHLGFLVCASERADIVEPGPLSGFSGR